MVYVPKCVVCLQAYNEYVRVPRLLACGHSYCELCLKQLQSSSATSSKSVIQCPECSHRTALSGASHESLPRNIELLRLLPTLTREPAVDVDESTDFAALDDDLQIRLQRWTMIDPPSTSQTSRLSMRTFFRRSAFGDSLPQGRELRAGESLVSRSTDYTFTNHEDGNLCIRNDDQGYSPWESRTSSKGRGDFILLTDGNLVLFDTEGTGKPIWASMSQGTVRAPGPYKLIMQDDGNLVVYGSNHAPSWASQSDCTSGHFELVVGTAEMPSSVTWLQTCDKLVSRNGQYSFVNQGDGNLCIYNRDCKSIWESGTRNKGAGNLYMQRDGDLVLYNTDGDGENPGKRIWSSGTARKGRAPYKLVVEDDGHLVIYDANSNRTWTSQTGAAWRSFTKSELLARDSLQSEELLVSPADKYTFINQADGNLVTYGNDGRPIWASETGPGRLKRGVLKLLADGNLVLFDVEGSRKPVWASMSQGNSRALSYRLCIRDDGNLVIYDGNSVIVWASRSLNTTSGLFTSTGGRAEMSSVVTWLQPCDKLVSRNGMYTFVNQRDGNLVIYNRDARAKWSSGTCNKGAGNLYMQRDGNLVLYNTDGLVGTPGEPIWSSATFGNGTSPYEVIMEDYGDLVIYDANRNPIWSTSGRDLDTLSSGDVLRTNEKLVSRNMKYTFVNQADGNLVIYNQRRNATWASSTNNKGVGNLYMQRDGNLVLYHTNGNFLTPRAPIWSSGGRRGTAPYRLIMQDDGNLVIYDTNHKPIWATNTNV